MSNARDKANIPALNFSSTGIDDNATSTAITINSSEQVGIGTSSPSSQLTVYRTTSSTTNGALQLDGNGNYAGVRFAISGTNQASIASDLSSLIITHQDVVKFKTGSDVNVGGSERMRIDSSGNVGIGTSSPNNLLHLSSDTPIPLKLNRTTNADTYISFKNTTDEWTAGLDTSEGFVIANGSFITTNPRLTIDSSGNVGIGTTAPVRHLHISSGVSTSLQLERTAVGSESKLLFLSATSFNSIYSRDGADSDKDFAIYTGSNERMRINSSGNVGINTSSPAQKLHIQTGGTTYLRTENTGISTVTDFGTDGTGSIIINRSAKPFRIFTDSTERMRIDSSGNVGIGTTSPSTPLQVNGTARASNFNTLSTQLVMNNSSQEWDISGVIGTIANVEGSISFELTMKERNASSVQLFRVYYIRVGPGTTFNISSAVWSVGSTSANTTISYPSAGTIRFTNTSFSVLDAQIRRISA